jgi:SPP1 gp7 family putative phage head morphogenesis protein
MAKTPAAIRDAAARLERDRSTLENRGIRAASLIGRRVRIAVINAFDHRRDPAAAIREQLANLQPLIVDGMVAAHLQGRRRSMIVTAPQMRAKAKTKLANTVYDDALDFLRRRLDLTPEELQQLSLTYRAPALRVIDGLSESLTSDIQSTIVELTQQGAGVRQGIRELRQTMNNAGVTPDSSYTLENVFRTQTQIGYSAGRWNGLQAPEIQEILWGFQYSTVGDDRVRPSHEAMDGVKLPKNDAFWSRNFPPNGYNCRCSAIEIFESVQAVEPVAKEIDGVLVQPEADQGFRVNFGTAYRDGLSNAA